jgi:tryptophan synthase alpha chain
MVDRARRARLRAIVEALVRGGADALELGFPFSDPIADGPVLQAAADRALANGTRFSDLLEQVRLASEILPTAVMTYANPIWRRGLRPSMRALHHAGATGLIVPDLSLEESAPWAGAARNSGLALALLAAPAISPERVGRIARTSRGFLYLVSRYGTTGPGLPSTALDLKPLVRAAHRAAPTLPVLVGFGVRDRRSVRQARSSGVDGVIVGSAVEERLRAGASPRAMSRWLQDLRRG